MTDEAIVEQVMNQYAGKPVTDEEVLSDAIHAMLREALRLKGEQVARASEREANPPAEPSEQPKEQPVAEDAESRESKMVVLRTDGSGVPTVWCDSEIADIVDALNADVVPSTVASCSGHGYRPGSIIMKDGRYLMIFASQEEAKYAESLYDRDINGHSQRPEWQNPNWGHSEEISDILDRHEASCPLENKAVAREVDAYVESYARHASARAVEAERQRLARLVEERIKDLQGTIEYVKRLGGGYSGSNNKLEELREVRSWLAGEGENA